MSTASNLTKLIKYCGIPTGELTEKENREYEDEYSRDDFMEKCLINDAIYGPIELTRLLYLIINTPEFDRLRHIKQLGAANYVYPGANHTRLDHSIGVSYLAGEFAKSLKEKIDKDSKNVKSDKEKKSWKFTEKEIICVQVAGLCHDLGHGPFSHMFETMVIKRIYEGDVEFEHEDLSVAIFKRLLVKNPKVLARFTKADLGLEEVKLIEKMIQPPKQKHKEDVTPLAELEPEQDVQRAFLFEIVANKETGIDVDKWDYYARDCHYLGVTNDFQWKRCMKLGRVVKKDMKLRIAFRDKEMDNLYGMFRIRGSLHQKAYQHKTSKAVEQMISDAMVLAGKDPQFDIIGVSNSDKPMTIKTAVANAAEYIGANGASAELLEGYLALTDCILSTIKGRAFITKSTQVAKIIERIEKRDLYHLSAKVRIPKEDIDCPRKKDQKEQAEESDKKCLPWEIVEGLRENPTELEELKTQVSDLFNESTKSHNIESTDLWIQIVRFKLASEKKDNPVNDVLFYKKPNGNEPIEVLPDDYVQDRLTSMLARPKALVEYEVRVYDKREAYVCKSGDSEALQDALDTWKDSLTKQ